jgi:hypothetical protein
MWVFVDGGSGFIGWYLIHTALTEDVEHAEFFPSRRRASGGGEQL